MTLLRFIYTKNTRGFETNYKRKDKKFQMNALLLWPQGIHHFFDNDTIDLSRLILTLV